MDIQQEFETAVAQSKQLPSKPSNEILLKLYSLYKQATAGDAGEQNISSPFDFVATSKYEAWAEQKGKPTEEAMKEYIALVNKLKSQA